jgi:hypothetical protein
MSLDLSEPSLNKLAERRVQATSSPAESSGGPQRPTLRTGAGMALGCILSSQTWARYPVETSTEKGIP